MSRLKDGIVAAWGTSQPGESNTFPSALYVSQRKTSPSPSLRVMAYQKFLEEEIVILHEKFQKVVSRGHDIVAAYHEYNWREWMDACGKEHKEMGIDTKGLDYLRSPHLSEETICSDSMLPTVSGAKDVNCPISHPSNAETTRARKRAARLAA